MAAHVLFGVLMPRASGGSDGRDVRGVMTGMLGAIGLCGIPRRRIRWGVFAPA
jgi:hypothetical protein